MSGCQTMSAAALVVLAATASASDNPDQPAIDACIDALMASGKANAPAGTVLNSNFSEAGTEVVLEDNGDTVWRCIAYSDGTVGVLEEANAERAEAARNALDISDYQEQVQFEPGTSGTKLTRSLGPGEEFQFVLGANEGQSLRVSVSPQNGEMYYIIRNPDGSILLDGTDSATPYEGQLWQSGDHIVEVVNKTSEDLTYDIYF